MTSGFQIVSVCDCVCDADGVWGERCWVCDVGCGSGVVGGGLCGGYIYM